jgi:hypothetical protein
MIKQEFIGLIGINRAVPYANLVLAGGGFHPNSAFVNYDHVHLAVALIHRNGLIVVRGGFRIDLAMHIDCHLCAGRLWHKQPRHKE